MQDLIVSEPGAGQILLLYGRRQWEKSGRLQDYAPVTLFRGEGGAGYGKMSLGATDGNGLVEVFFTGAWKTHYNEKLRESHGRAWLLKPQLAVKVDVRPVWEPNVVQLPGLLVVQVFGFSRAEGDQIEPSSARMAGVAPHQHLSQDFNGDGIPDLQLYFETGAMRLTSQTKRIALVARTRAGQLVGGSDAVEIIVHKPGGQRMYARLPRTINGGPQASGLLLLHSSLDRDTPCQSPGHASGLTPTGWPRTSGPARGRVI